MKIEKLSMLSLSAILLSAATASAAVQYNEFGYDMPSTDNGKEFIELAGTPGESLDGVWLVVLEGDVGGGGGVVEQAISLLSQSIGSNGLFLVRDSAAGNDPAPAAGTNIFVNDFTPDIENNTSNHILVRNFTSTVGTDLDSTDDGVLDSTPWTEVLDAVTLLENSGAELNYLATAGKVSSSIGNPDSAFRLTDGRWVGVVSDSPPGSGVGPYPLTGATTTLRLFDGTELDDATLDNPALTPGNINPTVVPEPAALSLLGIGGLAMLRRRRTR